MNSDLRDTLFGLMFLVVFFFGCIVGGFNGHAQGIKEMQEEAVRRGAAHYDAQTGQWQWNDKEQCDGKVQRDEGS